MAKPALTLRGVKGSGITNQEMDDNLSNLANAIVSVTVGSTTANIELNSGFTVANTANIVVSLVGSTLSFDLSSAVSGSLGSTGATGPVGYTGSQGVAGSNGSQGATGATGPQGYTGSQGAVGSTGATGVIGYTGSQGAVGSTGVFNNELSSPPIIGNVAPNAGTFTTLTNTVRANLKNITEGTVYNLGTTGGTIAPDVANGNVQKITLNSSLTINGFTNPIAGQTLTLIIYGGTGYTGISSTMKFSNNDRALTAIAGCIDFVSIFYDGSNYFASINRGFA